LPRPELAEATPISLSGPHVHSTSFSGSWQGVTEASLAARPSGSVVLTPVIDCWPSGRLIVSVKGL